ncbi:uncharacterized protein LOC115631645 [Scaptodrosophila lebanonensis]|uniref:Uncharacterized protein LOC115631645 n=1 Tax=Drosophila lebanonensis TaxID=7225 RepID=A0A6J2U711_DROLE|nr:uncharacterized protein LOC115631645 [Scaptodrosophila lebanonensis]
MTLRCVIKPKMWLGLKQTLLYAGLLLCVLLQVCRSKTQLFCPSVCSCDLYEQRNRAICSAKRLISANMEMPKTVELLDLSYNDITNVDADCFGTTVHLLNLTLAHNSIQTIHVDAFSTLRHLQALDLSYNRLEYVDEHMLESNDQLHYLNLEGNKLATLDSQPLLRSKSLRILVLRNAQINQISVELLSALPQLRQLDLAQNMLITVSSGAFYAPRFLTDLNLDENPLNCDRPLYKFARTLRQRGIALSMSDCQFELEGPEEGEQLDPDHGNANLEANIFQRIEQQIDIINEEPRSVMDVWRILPEDSDELKDEQPEDPLQPLLNVCEGTRDQLCQRYHNCLESVSETFLKRRHSYDEDDVKLAFVVGGATGICMVIFIIAFALCLKSCCELRRKGSSSEVDGPQQTADDAEPTVRLQGVASQPLTTLLPPAPPSHTRVPRRSNPPRHPRATSRALVRQPYGPQDNFVSRLFGRPARQQYYRTLNQNTATLIRRLSRSNLFTNRQSEPNSPATPPASTSQFYVSENGPSTNPPRPETPPPNYGDVVVIEHCDSK